MCSQCAVPDVGQPAVWVLEEQLMRVKLGNQRSKTPQAKSGVKAIAGLRFPETEGR